MAVAPNLRLDHYEILGPLGKGGMGEVWRARDTRLGREVAIKLLPASFTHDAARLRRFEQEARAVGMLNHPNILTIYDLGTASSELGGAPYIVTELLEGEELRATLKRGAMGLMRAMDCAIQIAEGLAAAHAKGIVHRDLKPENLFLTTDGRVKILDFGLAKLRPPEPLPDSDAPTQRKVTDPGTVMGTASYMSPEQARGLDVDARSDIFSLGLMLYEMLSGSAPFTGVNAIDVMGAILNQEPAPLRQILPDIPKELQRIVAKALRKDREQRYQHVKDLLIDLKDLKQELEFEAKLKGAPAFVVPPSGGSVGAREMPPEGGTTNATPEEIATKETAAASTTSSAEIILGEIKRHKVGVLIGLSVMLVTVSALAYGLYRIFAPRESAPHFQKVKFTRLTSLGNAKSAAISPDGRFIAYVQYENGRYSLWTKAVTTGSAVQIVPPTEVEDIHHTAFSPDGDYVYYLLTEINREDVLYQIPVLGGTPKKVAKDVLSPITFSPDGQQFAFTRKVETDYRVIVMKADSSAERILKPKMLNFFPSWSPDGKTIATGLFKDVQQMTVVGVDVQTETLKPLTRQTWARVGRIAWLKDLSGLLLAARERPEENVQLWKLSLPSGEASRITNDLNDYGIDEELRLGYARNFFPNLSITTDSRALVTTQSELSSSIWVVPVNKNQPARQLTFRGQTRDGYFGLVGTADGRIVYASTAGSNYTLWVMDGDGSRARQLTDARASDRFPAISPDGRYIIFSSNRAGQNNLWRIEMDGSNPKQLTKGKYDTDPAFSPDGRWLFYAGASPSTGLFALWKVSIEGGDPVQITEAGRWPAVSPDGQWIAYNYYDRQSLRTRAAIMPIAGGAPVKVLEYTSTRPRVRWSPDGQSLIYTGTDQGGTNLWRLPLDGGPPQKLTDFKSEQIYNFDLSGDGKQFLIARGTTTSDVVMISEVK